MKKRAQLEQKFIREERNQFRKNKQNKMFDQEIKVQINPEDKYVHLGIRVSTNHVHNIVFSLQAFTKAMSESNKSLQYHNWNLQKLSKHVKIYSNDYQFHYRLSHEQWVDAKKQFIAELEKRKLLNR